MKINHLVLAAVLSIMAASSCERSYDLEFLTTNDVHGASLSKVSYAVDSIRQAVGEQNVILLDCGDVVQGTVAAYYYNYVDSSKREHFFSRIFEEMDYDVAVMGNHDVEAGPAVYQRLKKEFGFPYLAANVVADDPDLAFEKYTVIKRNGLKVAVIGFTNAYVKNWVSPDKYEGIDFAPIYPMAQELADQVREKENPDILLVAVHSGVGKRYEDDPENNGYFLASRLKGVDGVICSHDHKFIAEMIPNGQDSVAIVEGGSRGKAMGMLHIHVVKKNGKVISKNVVPEVMMMDGVPSDAAFDEKFAPDYAEVEDFSNRKIGTLQHDLQLSYHADGPDPYMSFIHYIQLQQPGVQISLNAPLSRSGVLKKGDLIYNDLFSLYRFENLLYVIRMSGKEIRDYMENAYDLRLSGKDFMYNYDTAGGLIYEVSKSAPAGRRIRILSMADGTPFDEEGTYNVALTSYRASGAGGHLKAAGIEASEVPGRLVEVYPEIRNMMYQYILNNQALDVNKIASNKSVGTWKFVR